MVNSFRSLDLPGLSWRTDRKGLSCWSDYPTATRGSHHSHGTCRSRGGWGRCNGRRHGRRRVAGGTRRCCGVRALQSRDTLIQFSGWPGGTKAALDTMTGTPTPESGEIGAARELAAAELLGGRLAGTAGQGLKLTVKGLGSTDIDVFGAAGEYVGVGGPAKGLNLADFGRKLQILKAGAEQAGVEAAKGY